MSSRQDKELDELLTKLVSSRQDKELDQLLTKLVDRLKPVLQPMQDFCNESLAELRHSKLVRMVREWRELGGCETGEPWYLPATWPEYRVWDYLIIERGSTIEILQDALAAAHAYYQAIHVRRGRISKLVDDGYRRGYISGPTVGTEEQRLAQYKAIWDSKYRAFTDSIKYGAEKPRVVKELDDRIKCSEDPLLDTLRALKEFFDLTHTTYEAPTWNPIAHSRIVQLLLQDSPERLQQHGVVL